MNISLTNDCNRRCEFCFQKEWYLAKNKDEIKEMPLDMFEKAVDMANSDSVQVMGGEPLLYSKLPELFDLIRKKNKKISFLTNFNVDSNIVKDIILPNFDVISHMLINNDYNAAQEETYMKNLELLREKALNDDSNFFVSFGTTLLPDSEKNKDNIRRMAKTIDFCKDIKTFNNVRIAPMTPNHIPMKSYDFSLDILKFICALYEKRGDLSFEFDCTVNACELNPAVMKKFSDKNMNINYRVEPCSRPIVDILVDGSAVWCCSAKWLKVDSFLDYECLEDLEKALLKKWRNYWTEHGQKCDYKNCGKLSPAFCNGMCVAKTYSVENGLLML